MCDATGNMSPEINDPSKGYTLFVKGFQTPISGMREGFLDKVLYYFNVGPVDYLGKEADPSKRASICVPGSCGNSIVFQETVKDVDPIQ